MAGERHAMCESALTCLRRPGPKPQPVHSSTLPITTTTNSDSHLEATVSPPPRKAIAYFRCVCTEFLHQLIRRPIHLVSPTNNCRRPVVCAQCGDKKWTKLQFLPYGRSIGLWIRLTHKTYTCHTLQCCACRLYSVPCDMYTSCV
jgi:hypothetical protein